MLRLGGRGSVFPECSCELEQFAGHEGRGSFVCSVSLAVESDEP